MRFPKRSSLSLIFILDGASMIGRDEFYKCSFEAIITILSNTTGIRFGFSEQSELFLLNYR